jgi:drug/metabolite transporter (DMT)-like permease
VSRIDIAMLCLYALGMSTGQVLFKLAADRARTAPENSFWVSVLGNGYFYIAVAVYAALTIAWVWILTRVPLSRAYPFVVLAFVITPLLANLFFGEHLDLWYFASLALIVCGLMLLVLKVG